MEEAGVLAGAGQGGRGHEDGVPGAVGPLGPPPIGQGPTFCTGRLQDILVEAPTAEVDLEWVSNFIFIDSINTSFL